MVRKEKKIKNEWKRKTGCLLQTHIFQKKKKKKENEEETGSKWVCTFAAQLQSCQKKAAQMWNYRKRKEKQEEQKMGTQEKAHLSANTNLPPAHK